MEYDKIGLGYRIAAARTNKKLTQLDMCDKLRMSQSTYSRIENGKQNIDISALYKMAIIFDVPFAWLTSGEDKPDDITVSESLEIEKYKQYIISIRKK